MKLIDKLPSFYNNSITRKIQDAYDIELETLRETYDDTFDQFFVDTATWGLDYWENILSIKNRFDLSIEDRRSNIKAKMRGKGTTTVEVVKAISEAYTKTDVDVKVFSNLFSFTLSFITNDCSYNTILELDKKIEEIKPAHLEHRFEMILFNQNNMFAGSTMNTGETVTIYPYSPTDITSFGELTITTGNDRSMEKVTLYPRQEVV
ncbi:YmfQ family protein [Clostridioides difficile]|nr:YmfQ family protein [Clostridioides difficile]MBY1715171.1 YmfQ family protein [Clostridioides difficile]MBZ0643177.1 YmfQ family protein [Clostridioides difficile]MBZ0648407.1 YmfQ family protein [Clostridioides difficile]MCA0724221.1 YmfQ family protein [Clostridioides difficile]